MTSETRRDPVTDELQRDWAREETVPGFMNVFANWDGSNPEKDFKG